MVEICISIDVVECLVKIKLTISSGYFYKTEKKSKRWVAPNMSTFRFIYLAFSGAVNLSNTISSKSFYIDKS